MNVRAFLGLLAVLLVVAPIGAATPGDQDENLGLLTPAEHGKIVVPTDARAVGGGLSAAADYLVAMQADITEDNAGNGTDGMDETPDDPDDGGWDWMVTSPPAPFHHTTAASPTNCYGVSVLGIYYAYLRDPQPAYLTAMTDAGDAMVAAGTGSIRTASDMIFMMLYNDLPEVSGTTYSDAAKAKYDARMVAYGGAEAWAEYIRDARGASYPNGIIPWDVAPYVVAAAMLEARYGGTYGADADAMAEVLYQDSYMTNPGYFDIDDDAGWDPTYADVNFYWYTLGISGLLNAFSAAGVHTDLIPDLTARIQASMYPSGAVSYCYGAHENDEDWQSTGYCAMALGQYDQAGFRSELGEMAGWLQATQDPVSGGWVYSNGHHYPETCGEATSGMFFGASTVGPLEPTTGPCVSTIDPCVTVPFQITRLDAADMRGFSVTFSLSGPIELCDDPDLSITQGDYLNSIGGTYYAVQEISGGVYRVDCAILGVPCGATDPDGTLFELQVKSSGVDGTGTIAVEEVILRDCDNVPIPSALGEPIELNIDATAPVAIGDLDAVQVKTGNDADGTTKIDLAFTLPVEGDYAETVIYRKGFGSYPEYDDDGGAVPETPATPAEAEDAGWELVGTNATGTLQDEPAVRDFYYYIAFSMDDCGNVSAVSNQTGGTLNYHLGDVVEDNYVTTNDISALSSRYWQTVVAPEYVDVGPTTDYTVDALPTTDNLVDFEDLMMFAINFQTVNTVTPVLVEGETAALRLVWSVSGEGMPVARLVLDNPGLVKGVHAVVAFNESELTLKSVEAGSAVGAEGFFMQRTRLEGVELDAAILGHGATFTGSEVAVLRFQPLHAGARPSLTVADLRGVENGFLTGSAAVDPLTPGPSPVKTALLMARPNPFTGRTEISFQLASEMPVALRIFDASGRLVRTLIDDVMSAGDHGVSWDGRTQDGGVVSPGIYFYAFRAEGSETTRKLILMR
ncbi:MAG: T9SS type A sorting domain-containing protein [Candidatus Eisenbacteria bacterium]|nr:T9SS type A sorting domain-containing protein [Candidatus Eisenbacteria bacterium]